MCASSFGQEKQSTTGRVSGSKVRPSPATVPGNAGRKRELRLRRDARRKNAENRPWRTTGGGHGVGAIRMRGTSRPDVHVVVTATNNRDVDRLLRLGFVDGGKTAHITGRRKFGALLDLFSW